ncbi:restriction endonuclease subunit S [Yokenella regensburgei]|uniref:restriction endonuclease subunit S n=1 Tax=Yokenella regensburgei TaxID=158877 RepID=UPI0002420B31|nr:restriction endonuclease subunit S [Yokenella regensburgei]EHM51574.1 type I restriction modification DNA specificity domain protein [Yokenella regensburgei ATCC 43003]
MSDLMPKEWILGKASDFVVSPKNDIVDGPFGSNLKASEYQLSGTPIIRLQNIKRLCFINKNIKYVSNEKAIELSRHSYKKGDIVITKLGDPLGLACIIPENFQDGIIVADLVRLRINDLAFDKRYLTYLLNSPLVISQLNKHIKGTTRPRINLGIIRDLNLPIASISEQKIIAEKLDTLLAQVDSTKARLEQIPQILKRFRQAVLAAAVSGLLIGSNKRNHHPLCSQWQWPDLPSTWSVHKYSELVDSRLGKMLDKAKNFGSATKYLGNINVRWFSFDLENLQDILISDIERRELSLNPGDVLICEGGEPGRCAIWSEPQDTPVIFQKALHRARVKEKIIPEWLVYNLKNDSNNISLSQLFTGTTIKHLTGKALANYPIRVPPLKEQLEIVRRVEQLFAYADTIEKQVNSALTRVNNLTQSILAKAFRGELTAQWRAENPELISGENSAAALLEKIKAERAASGGKKNSRKKA